jgi:curved DNA-binding protein CbpA
MKDYYKILNIDRHASDQEVKKAYRELALKFHPDKSKFDNAHQRFTEINEAYQILGRKNSRENYNFVFDYDQLQ